MSAPPVGLFTPYYPILVAKCCIVKLVNILSNRVIKFQDYLKVKLFLFSIGRVSRDL